MPLGKYRRPATKWMVEFVSGVGQESICLASMQSRNEHRSTVMGPAGENYPYHHHPLRDLAVRLW